MIDTVHLVTVFREERTDTPSCADVFDASNGRREILLAIIDINFLDQVQFWEVRIDKNVVCEGRLPLEPEGITGISEPLVLRAVKDFLENWPNNPPS